MLHSQRLISPALNRVQPDEQAQLHGNTGGEDLQLLPIQFIGPGFEASAHLDLLVGIKERHKMIDVRAIGLIVLGQKIQSCLVEFGGRLALLQSHQVTVDDRIGVFAQLTEGMADAHRSIRIAR